MLKYPLKLKRTDAGQIHNAELLADVACCDAVDYDFSFGINWDILRPSGSVTIKIRDGCPPFTWATDDAEYTFASSPTTARTNILSASAVATAVPVTITVTDSCSEIITQFVNNYAPKVKSVRFSPEDGAVVASTDTITLSCSTAGATIYYTKGLNAPPADPTITSSVYSTPITIGNYKYWKAFAVKTGMLDSPISGFTIGYDIVNYNTFDAIEDRTANTATGIVIVQGSAIPMGQGGANGTAISYIVFEGLDIPNGSTILEAKVVLNAYQNSSGGSIKNLLYFVNQDDVGSAPATLAEFQSLLAICTAGVGWNFTTAWVHNVQYDSINLATILQTIVNRPGWVSGNDVAFMHQDNISVGDGLYRYFSTIDDEFYGQDGTRPELYVKWRV